MRWKFLGLVCIALGAAAALLARAFHSDGLMLALMLALGAINGFLFALFVAREARRSKRLSAARAARDRGMST